MPEPVKDDKEPKDDKTPTGTSKDIVERIIEKIVPDPKDKDKEEIEELKKENLKLTKNAKKPMEPQKVKGELDPMSGYWKMVFTGEE